MIIIKFIFRVPYVIISKAVINFAIYFKHTKYKSFICYASTSFFKECKHNINPFCLDKAKVAFNYLANKFTILLAFKSFTKYFRISLNLFSKI